MKVVFIGADPKVSEMAELSLRLCWPDTTPIVATTATAGMELIEHSSPDVVLLHPSFSDMSLSEAIRDLRRFSNTPLMVLGHVGGDMEVVTALQQGADDYIRLPCELTELMARVWAILRRAGFITRQEGEKPVRSGELLVNPTTYQVFLGNQRVVLTPTEFKLLHLLVRNRGTVVSHQTLGNTLWGDQVDSTGLVKKYVQRVRRKLGDTAQKPCWIVSIHGTGYRFIGPKEEEEKEVKDSELAVVH